MKPLPLTWKKRIKKITPVVWINGESKAEAVHHALEDDENIELYPAQLIDAITGEVQWFIDETAAANLEEAY